MAALRPDAARRPDSFIMSWPLALPGEGLHFVRVKALLIVLLVALLVSPAFAQVETDDEPPDRERVEISPLPPLVLDPEPLVPPNLDLPPPAPLPEAEPETESEGDPLEDVIPDAPTTDSAVDSTGIPEAPDYSRLSPNEERAARLDDMFARLSEAETEEAGNLIAEEIWAVWLDSGSASVNLVLRRGAAAQTGDRTELARTLFDHVTRLEPDFAEGWARSSRLALEEGDFSRAVGEAIRALSLEPRHFYALWTLGNVLERMGRFDEALEAYQEASRLYPTLTSVSERVTALELRLGGAVL